VSVRLHHEISGRADAPPLLLGNSLGTDMRIWDGVVAALGDRYRVVRFDHRGQGASPVPAGPYEIADLGADVVALLDALAIDTAWYCGVSIGGMVGLWLAAHAPERVRGLVICCSSAHPGDPQKWAERAATVRAAGTTAPVVDAVAAGWVTEAFAAEHPEVLARLKAMLAASPPVGYAALCDVLETLDLRAELERVQVPTLVIGGAQDTSIPPEHSERIAAGIMGARYELLDPGAHVPMVERPDAIATLVVEATT
jgi:3-oxoadipate enol-lactonase